ncbi:MAG: CD225/dispanin family protein [Chitinophagaceae bacterium]
MEPNEQPLQPQQPQFQQPQFRQPGVTPPDNYLVWAILSTIFCCLPFGIVSIVKSTQVNNKFIAGDIEGAKQSAAAAKKWAIISAIAWVVFIIIYLSIFGFAIFYAAKNDGFNSY